MQHTEMDKLTAWMMGVFPQWKPDKCVSAVWAHELGSVTADEVICAIRAMMSKEPSPFPPGMFEIKAAMSGRVDPEREAKIQFSIFWNEACGAATSEPSEKGNEAYRLVGDDYHNSLLDDKPWHERRFVDIYCGLEAKQPCGGARLLAPELKQLKRGGG